MTAFHIFLRHDDYLLSRYMITSQPKKEVKYKIYDLFSILSEE